MSTKTIILKVNSITQVLRICLNLASGKHTSLNILCYSEAYTDKQYGNLNSRSILEITLCKRV